VNIQLDWQAGDEAGRWETIATVEKRFSLKVSRWIWRTLLVVVVSLVTGTYLGVRYRYEQAYRRITSEIQATVDLEAQALEQGNAHLFLAQQDEMSRDWYRQQTKRFWMYHILCESSTSGSDSSTSHSARQEDCPSVTYPEVQEVDLRGDVAWVEVIEGSDLVRRARFYQQTDRGWKRTAPRAEFWRDPVELAYGNVTVQAQQRDLPHIEPLVDHMVHVVSGVSTMLGDAANGRLEVSFVTENPPDRFPDLAQGKLILVSPWLTGIPVGGTWDREYLDELGYWVAYAMLKQVVLPSTGTLREKAATLNPLQRALVGEDELFYSQGDATQAPILRRAIELHGVDSLPELLYSARKPGSTSEFIARWLFSSAPTESAYLHTLMDIGREAVQTGRKDSFALVDLALFEYVTGRSRGIEPQYLDFVVEQIESEQMGIVTGHP
jgi:hypothetical protein